jgi:hypothetical protein
MTIANVKSKGRAMHQNTPSRRTQTDAQEMAKQADVELSILLGIEQSLRVALQWMTRGRGNSHKLSTLRFHTWSFERHLTRIRALADHGGYMHVITDAKPHLASKVAALQERRVKLHDTLEKLVIELELVSQDDFDGFTRICLGIQQFLDDLRAHGQQESELLQHAVSQESGGQG